jgi:WD40 repeat protein
MHKGMVGLVAMTADGTQVASGNRDGTVQVWDAQTDAAVGKSLRGHDN